MSKKSLIAVLVVLFMSIASAQTLTIAMSAQPDTLDPQATAATAAFQVDKSFYDTLVEVDPMGELVPALASSYEVSEDGLSYTFHLVTTKFSDGTAFDSADVKATIERVADAAVASPKVDEFEAIATIDTPDARTVVLHLSKPNAAMLATLASGWGAMLPSEKIAEGHDFGNTPVGTGPFVLKQWTRDSNLLMTRNADYYQGAPALDQVTIRFVQDSAVQFQGLLSGEFDIIDTVASADQPAVESNPDLRLVREPSGLVLVAALNNRKPYLSDPNVRRAINLAIDKEVVLDAAYGGGTPVGTFMEVGSPWLPASIQPFPYDPEQAKSLLAAANIPADWTLDIVLPQPYEQHIQAGQIVQDMLSEVGIRSEIRIVEWGVWLSDVYRGAHDFDITVVGHTGKLDPTGRLGGYGDPDTNYVGFSDPAVVKELSDAAATTDPVARKALYAEALTSMHDEAPFLYFGTPYRVRGESAKVQGFWATPLLDSFDFRSTTLD